MRRAPLRFGPLLALVFVSMLLPMGAHAQDPDFSTTTDILNGQRRMLRADDLALVYQDVAAAPLHQYRVYGLLLTQNSQMAQAQFLTATATSGVALPGTEVQAAIGRMFDRATDITAVAAVEANVPGNAGCRAL